MSKLEEKIISLFKEDNVEFEREKRFVDLKKYGNNLRFDFYIPNRRCIVEVNGEQHYKFVPRFYKNRLDFIKRQEYDRYKISYCLARGIKIYCIPYWEVANLRRADEIFNDKFLAKDRWKNDQDWREHKI